MTIAIVAISVLKVVLGLDALIAIVIAANCTTGKGTTATFLLKRATEKGGTLSGVP